MHQQLSLSQRQQSELDSSCDNKTKPILANKQKQILDNLIKSYQILSNPSPSSQQLYIAHQLIQFYLKHQGILQILLQLLQRFNSSNQTISKLIITHIFSYLKKHSFHNTKNTSNYHDNRQINQIMLCLFIYNNKIDVKFKKMLQNCYMQFLLNINNTRLREDTANVIEAKLSQVLAKSDKNLRKIKQYNKFTNPIEMFLPHNDIADDDSLILTYNMIHLFRVLFQGGSLQITLMKKILSSFFSVYYSMINLLIRKIVLAIQNKQQIQFSIFIEMCEKFVEIYLLGIAKLQSGKYPALRQRLIHTKQIINQLIVLLSLSTDFSAFQFILSNQKQQNPLFGAITKQSNLHEIQTLVNNLQIGKNFLNIKYDINKQSIKLNKLLINIKIYSLQIFIKFMKILRKKDSNQVQKYPYLTNLTSVMFVIFKDSLIIKNQQHMKINQQSQRRIQFFSLVEQLFGLTVKFLSETIRANICYNVAQKSKNQLLFLVALPWLISRKQHQKFSASDYLYFRQDIVNKQNMSYIQNHMANFIQSYLDNIDGCLSLIMSTCMKIIQYCLTHNPQHLSTISPNITSSWIFTYYSSQRLIQSSFTMLTICSYLSLNRNDIIIQLQRFLILYEQYFFSYKFTNKLIIMVQYFILYSYYVDNFYMNIIQNKTFNIIKSREYHKKIIEFACFVMKQAYDYQKNQFKSKYQEILYLESLDAVNNVFNQSLLFPALYYSYPSREELYMNGKLYGEYVNYPFYPPVTHNMSHNNKNNNNQYNNNKDTNILNLLTNQPKSLITDQNQQKMSLILCHYRKIGINQQKYIDCQSIIKITKFLLQNLQTKSNIKILQIFVQFLLQYIKNEMKKQGGLNNIPIIIRDQIVKDIAIKLYELMGRNQQKNKNNKRLPNYGLFMAKASELLYIVHKIAIDPYYIYSLGLQLLWLNPNKLWGSIQHNDQSQSLNLDTLLKCTDIITRLALSKYSSIKNINIQLLLQQITLNITQNSFKYIKSVHKFNVIFGILLNLILMKVKSQKVFQFLYMMIKGYLFKKQESRLKKESDNDQNNNQQKLQQQHQQQQLQQQQQQLSSQQITLLLQQTFYLFLCNIFTNIQSLSSSYSFQILSTFTQYLKNYTNSHKIVYQIGDVFGKIFSCCLCIIQKQYSNNTLYQISASNITVTLEFLWKNVLYSGKIYQTEYEKKIVVIKLMKIIIQAVRKNDQYIGIERLTNMYELAASCVFYLKNKDTLMMVDDDDHNNQDYDSFDQLGEQQQWQYQTITLNHNQTNLFIQDQVLLLKSTTKQLLQSQSPGVREWIYNTIQKLPVAVKNFVKNKVLYYQEQLRETYNNKLRKIVKVKRPGNYDGGVNINKQYEVGSNIKKDIVMKNINEKKQKSNNRDSQNSDDDE